MQLALRVRRLDFETAEEAAHLKRLRKIIPLKRKGGFLETEDRYGARAPLRVGTDENALPSYCTVTYCESYGIN